MRIKLLWLLPVFLLTAVAAYAAPDRFSADSGVLNVRDFGAFGDGQNDDTDALLAAINAAGDDTGPSFWRTRIVYLPHGTYLVSQPLMKRYANGKFGSGLILIGDSAATTTIRLMDRADGFGNAGSPCGVIVTTSKLLDGTPTSGGKDYTGKGEGNDAYENFVESLTIDVGHGNPGAIGIDYLANNIGAIRDVRVIAPAGSGAIGIAMLRKWPGPALLQRVEVDGFETGISVRNSEYGVTLDHVTLTGQRRTALVNDGNTVAAANLKISASQTAIANPAAEGLVVLTNSDLSAANPRAIMLANGGTVVAHHLSLDGFKPPDGGSGPLSGVWAGKQWQRQPARNYDLPDAPEAVADSGERRVNVMHYAKSSQDITDALRQAMATGAATVYLPYGRYFITDGIVIPPTLRRFVSMNASIGVKPERQATFARSTGMFQIAADGPPLSIERVVFDMTDLGDQLAVQVTGRRDVTLRDVVTAGTSLLDRGPQGGRVFIEDVCCGGLHIAGPNPVYARQLDTEGGGTRIVNDGSPLTVLGLKTEGDCVVLDNRGGGSSVILGGLLYVVHDADPKIPAFRNDNGTLLASFAEESFRAASRYTIYLEDGGAHREIPASAAVARGFGRIVPWLTTNH